VTIVVPSLALAFKGPARTVVLELLAFKGPATIFVPSLALAFKGLVETVVPI
jgi:hypothetical protein